MAKSKKTAPALREVLQGRKNHPIYMILDFHESDIKRVLAEKGDEAPDSVKMLLSRIARVQRHIDKQDAEGAAVFMYELALYLQQAGFALLGKKRIGKKYKDRQWLDAAIHHAMKLKGVEATRHKLWNYYKVNHNGVDSAFEIETGGGVYFEDGEDDENSYLCFDEGGELERDQVQKTTFFKKVSALRKKVGS